MKENWRELDGEELTEQLIDKLASPEGWGMADSEKRSTEEQVESARLEAAALANMTSQAHHRRAILEAVLFAAAYPVTVGELSQVCGWPVATVQSDLEELSLELQNRGIRLQRIAGACRLVTAAEYAHWVERYLKVRNRVKLSRPQMETLAVIAYNQPVTRAIIDAYRGVRSERIIGQLEELHLIKEVGRADTLGRPILYGTTSEFLQYFALNSLKDLPQLFQDKKKKTSENEEESMPIEPLIPEAASSAEEGNEVLNKPSESLQNLLARMHRKQQRVDKKGSVE